MEPEARGLYARVHGIVQGVGFRYAVVSRARALHLSGYVRNMNDGSVEVVAEGPAAKLSQLLAWLNHGPAGARVTGIDHRSLRATGTHRGFDVAW